MMKKNLSLYSIFLFLAVCLFSSCELEMSDNGKLDGYWHLEKISSVSSSDTTDLSQMKRFWAFQNHLLYLSEIDGTANEFIMHFSYEGQTVSIYDVHYNDRDNGDPELTDASLLAPYGIESLQQTFQVEKLTSNKLILTSENQKLSFTKL